MDAGPLASVIAFAFNEATLLESGLVLVGKVDYGNGWNLSWTFVSYLLACSLTYGGYLIVKSEV